VERFGESPEKHIKRKKIADIRASTEDVGRSFFVCKHVLNRFS
jgi:hypothetical protein